MTKKVNKYTDQFGNNLYNDDARNVLENTPDCVYDLIISDPPYNIDYNNNRRIKTRDSIHGVDGIKNDKDNLDMIADIYGHYFRTLKEGKHIYIFSRWDVVQDHIDILKDKGFIIKNNLIWMKNSWSMGDLYGDYAGQYENIIFGYKPYSKGKRKGKGDKLNKLNGKTRHSNILQYNRVVGKDQIHSHQKPIDLLQFLILKSSKPGDRLCESFIGSNSLGLAAMSLLRQYDGSEMEKDFFPKLLEKTKNITDLFYNYINSNNNEYLFIPDINTFIISNKYKITKPIIIKKNKKKILEFDSNYLDNIDYEEYKNFKIYILPKL